MLGGRYGVTHHGPSIHLPLAEALPGRLCIRPVFFEARTSCAAPLSCRSLACEVLASCESSTLYHARPREPDTARPPRLRR